MSRERRPSISVKFHPHALDRMRERFPWLRKEKLRGWLKQRIAVELRKGAQLNKSGALAIEVAPGIWAVCFASLMGGWEVMTVYTEAKEGEAQC